MTSKTMQIPVIIGEDISHHGISADEAFSNALTEQLDAEIMTEYEKSKQLAKELDELRDI